MKLKEIMTANLENVSTNTPLSEAAHKMAAFNIGFLPVIDSGGIVGVVTDRDIVVRSVAEGDDPTRTPVEKVMSRDVESLPEETDVEEAAKLMEEKQIRRLLVRDENGRNVGVVSLGDLAVKTDDEQLSGEVLEEISEPPRPAR